MSSESWHQDVLIFWFEELTKKDWFMSSTTLDETIKKRFASIHTQLSKNTDLADDTDKLQALASVIVLDQFSRNMFRGTPHAFASDPLSLHFTNQAIERQLDQSMTTDQKQFLYMPLMHAENISDQKRGLPYFAALGLSEHAIEHMEIIERFGRFPHRNTVLGRQSTADEINYLKDAKRYGQ